MGDGDHPSRSEPNERNAANEAAFQNLPAAGTPTYWERLQDTAPGSRLALEVLVMCARERLAAGRDDQAKRVFEILLIKVQGTIEGWIGQLTPRNARDRMRLIEDIKQEVAAALWQEVAPPAPTFLTEGFWHKARLLTMNTVEQRLIAEGVKTRKDVERPTRVPQSQSDSLDQPSGPEESRTLAESVADPGGDAYSLIELISDIKALLADLPPEGRLLLENEITGELTQREMGERLGITDRAVRMRLEALRVRLRARYHAPDSSGGEGGAASGEGSRP
ncbi:MAG TPA: hypothetical protein VF808_13975 [Ktedonobacterales bacterium]